MKNVSTEENGDKKERLTILLHLASEINTEIRSRREPEYIYTAAVVGAMAAIVWGVLSIQTNKCGILVNISFFNCFHDVYIYRLGCN